MPDDGGNTYVIDCPECDWSKGADEYEKAMGYEKKHREHTGHQPRWAEADLEVEIDSLTNWSLYCPTCNEEWRFDEEWKATDFRHDHAIYTDHTISNVPEKVELRGEELESIREDTSLLEIIEELEGNFDQGIPERLLIGWLAGDQDHFDELAGEIQDLKMDGMIYEPQRGYISTV